jgi:tRNA threonylcarbamoyladenosine biosynthesis protein TsaB
MAMWVLAVDTATPLPGVALAGDETERQAALPIGRQASEALLPGLVSLLDSAHLSFGDVGRLAVCSGPGSFTGIRVGLATVWGLSRALSIPVEPFGSLEAAAELARPSAESVCVGFAAERGEVYFGRFDLRPPRARELASPALAKLEAAAALCPDGETLRMLESRPGSILPALAAARAVHRAPGDVSTTPRASYVRLSAAEEFRGFAAS